MGNWKVSATDEVSRIKARIDVGNTFGREIRMTCEVVKGRKGDLEVKDFEVIGIDYEPAQ